MLTSPRSLTLGRTGSCSPVMARPLLRENLQTARPSARSARSPETADPLQSLFDREIERVGRFEQETISEIKQVSAKLIRDIKTSQERLEGEVRQKCAETRTKVHKLLSDGRNSNTELKDVKGTADSSDGKLMELSFALNLPIVDLRNYAKCIVDWRVGQQTPTPTLEQNLASPEYRRLKPLANYYERNKATMPQALQELYAQILKMDSCRTIQLPSHLSEKDVPHLCTLLEYSVGIRELCLDGRCLGPRGGTHLSKTFASLSSLTLLNLRSNNLGDEGLLWLAAALPKLQRLLQLFLSSNNIGMEGAMHIARTIGQLPRLREFSLSANPLGSKGAVFLSGSLPDMRELVSINLSACSIGPEGALALLSVLGRIPKLKKIFIGNNDLGEEGRKLLGKIPGIRVFH